MRRLLEVLLVAVPAAVLMLLPMVLGAQDFPLDSGARVRVSGRVTRGVPIVARVLETRADTLVLDDGANVPLVLLAGDLNSIEVRREHPSRQAAITAGVLLGAAGGTAAAVNLCRGRGPDCWMIETDGNNDGDTDDDEDGMLPSIGVLTVGAAAFIGGALGALATPSRWKRLGGVTVAPVRVGMRGARRGIGMVVSIPFGGPARDRSTTQATR